jgi:hypothetical protein
LDRCHSPKGLTQWVRDPRAGAQRIASLIGFFAENPPILALMAISWAKNGTASMNPGLGSTGGMGLLGDKLAG